MYSSGRKAEGNVEVEKPSKSSQGFCDYQGGGNGAVF